MSITTNKTTLALAAGTVLTAGLALSPTLASADTNPFASAELSSGYMQLAEGNCGGNMKDEAKEMGEGRCGANKESKAKKAEGKCGEAKCGADKKSAAEAAKAKEGNCGGNMKDEAKEMGEGKCGGKK